LPSLISPNNNY